MRYCLILFHGKLSAGCSCGDAQGRQAVPRLRSPLQRSSRPRVAPARHPQRCPYARPAICCESRQRHPPAERRHRFGQRRRRVTAARSSPDAACQSALRNRIHQDQRTYLRRRAQAMAAEGHRTRARRLDSLADMASWRNDLRAAAPRLFVQDAEEGVACRFVPGDFRSR